MVVQIPGEMVSGCILPGETILGCIYIWRDGFWLFNYLERRYLIVLYPYIWKDGIWFHIYLGKWYLVVHIHIYLERRYLVVYIPGETIIGCIHTWRDGF